MLIDELTEVMHLRNLLLTIYLITHLRGNAVLDADRENDAYTKGELALALITGQLALTGTSLQVT